MCPYLLTCAIVWLFAVGEAAPTQTPPVLSIPRGEVPLDVSPTPNRSAPKEPQ